MSESIPKLADPSSPLKYEWEIASVPHISSSGVIRWRVRDVLFCENTQIAIKVFREMDERKRNRERNRK